MTDLYDFNDKFHRSESSSVCFQKGICHLYFLKYNMDYELFSLILRTYQCIFQLTSSILLLNFKYELKPKNLNKHLKKYCKDPSKPRRDEIDPAALITHAAIEKTTWLDFYENHPLINISIKAHTIFHKVLDTRNNILYRPFLLNGRRWSDCELLDLSRQLPDVIEIEKLYKEFIEAIHKLYDIYETVHIDKLNKDIITGNRFARTFYKMFNQEFTDSRDERPTENLFLSYARLLLSNKPDSEIEAILKKLVEYRNNLVENIGTFFS